MGKSTGPKTKLNLSQSCKSLIIIDKILQFSSDTEENAHKWLNAQRSTLRQILSKSTFKNSKKWNCYESDAEWCWWKSSQSLSHRCRSIEEKENKKQNCKEERKNESREQYYHGSEQFLLHPHWVNFIEWSLVYIMNKASK